MLKRNQFVIVKVYSVLSCRALCYVLHKTTNTKSRVFACACAHERKIVCTGVYVEKEK